MFNVVMLNKMHTASILNPDCPKEKVRAFCSCVSFANMVNLTCACYKYESGHRENILAYTPVVKIICKFKTNEQQL